MLHSCASTASCRIQRPGYSCLSRLVDPTRASSGSLLPPEETLDTVATTPHSDSSSLVFLPMPNHQSRCVFLPTASPSTTSILPHPDLHSPVSPVYVRRVASRAVRILTNISRRHQYGAIPAPCCYRRAIHLFVLRPATCTPATTPRQIHRPATAPQSHHQALLPRIVYSSKSTTLLHQSHCRGMDCLPCLWKYFIKHTSLTSLVTVLQVRRQGD